ANFKRLVMESINPTECLVAGEELGHDERRELKMFPKLKFYTDRDWNEYKRAHRQVTRIGDEVIRGKKKSALGENHTALYLENIDGSPASGDYVNDARKFTRNLINLAISTKCVMPKKWGEADVWFQELFYTALRQRFPLFQLCHNNAKGNIFMAQVYYEAVTRKWENISATTVNLNDALYSFKTNSDDEACQGDSNDVPDAQRAGLPAPRPHTKRPSENTVVPTKPAQRIRTQPNDPQTDTGAC
ncbi:hypothetical protein BD311DRAFT_677564, partial [Dichomitus squalens]